jgi:hypothetical protein
MAVEIAHGVAGGQPITEQATQVVDRSIEQRGGDAHEGEVQDRWLVFITTVMITRRRDGP